jgi:hypothetical protein
MTYSLYQQWSGGGWVNSFNTTMTYNGSLLATATMQMWSGGWVNFRRNVYTYSGNLLIEDMSQAPTGPSTWSDAEKTTYTYDGSNRMTLALSERWGVSGPWTNWTKIEYAYDGSSTNETLEAHSNWNGADWDGVWADTSRYSGNNRIELVTYWFQIASLSRMLSTYDGSNNLIEDVTQGWTGFSWMNSWRTVYIYTVAGIFDDEGHADIPSLFQLDQNYPNPFNLSTAIPYSLSGDSQVRITVCNLLGQTVRALLDSYQQAGPHIAVWDGRDQAGREVASGIYFFRVQVEGIAQVRKMALLK